MQKIVINSDTWFDPSEAAIRAYAARKGIELYDVDDSQGNTRYWTVPPGQRPVKPESYFGEGSNEYYAFERKHQLNPQDLPRNDPDFVAVVAELGAAASGDRCVLKVVEIPADVKWYIEDVGHSEIVHEEHRTWS